VFHPIIPVLKIFYQSVLGRALISQKRSSWMEQARKIFLAAPAAL